MPYSVYYSDHAEVPLPPQHRFPMEKYRLIREALLEKQILAASQLHPGMEASINDIKLAHDDQYVDDVLNLQLPPKQARAIGLPQSREMVHRTRISLGAFLQAVESSQANGVSASLSGGTHHACKNSGGGYCFFNDFAVAAHKLWQKKQDTKILVLDLDVHQGNGNSEMLTPDHRAYVVSFHGEKNYPFRKIASDLDVGFASGTKDDEYLSKLENVLGELYQKTFDQLLYQAGTDGLKSDTLGHLHLSLNGLYERDLMVCKWAKEKKIPMAVALGGGYARPISDTVEASVNTHRAIQSIFT